MLMMVIDDSDGLCRYDDERVRQHMREIVVGSAR